MKIKPCPIKGLRGSIIEKYMNIELHDIFKELENRDMDDFELEEIVSLYEESGLTILFTIVGCPVDTEDTNKYNTYLPFVSICLVIKETHKFYKSVIEYIYRYGLLETKWARITIRNDGSGEVTVDLSIFPLVEGIPKIGSFLVKLRLLYPQLFRLYKMDLEMYKYRNESNGETTDT